MKDRIADFDLRGSIGSHVSYIPGLDGIRAISVILVMISHFGFESAVPGGLGVTIFFFISGMLITTLLVTEQEKNGKISLSKFYVRRILRLAPELIVFVIITIIISPLIGSPPPWSQVTAVLFYVYNYFEMYFDRIGGSVDWGQLWSLSVEEHFYLFYPIVIGLILHKKRLLSLVLVAFVTLPLIRRIYVVSHEFPVLYTNHATETRIDSIVYGCIFAILVRYSDFLKNSISKIAWQLGVCSLVVLTFTLMNRDQNFRETVRYSIQGMAIFGIFFSIYFSAVGKRLLEFLELPLMAWGGRMSYGAYLWHLLPVQLLIFGGWSDLSNHSLGARIGVAVVLTGTSFGLAALSHRLVFRRFAPLRHRFGAHNSR